MIINHGIIYFKTLNMSYLATTYKLVRQTYNDKKLAAILLKSSGDAASFFMTVKLHYSEHYSNPKACPHFEKVSKNQINCSQMKKQCR